MESLKEIYKNKYKQKEPRKKDLLIEYCHFRNGYYDEAGNEYGDDKDVGDAE